MNSIELIAPAKVNLFLKVLSRRQDGYHNILTLFERVSLSDNIRISKIPSGIVLSADKFITKDTKDNLAYRAAKSVLDLKKPKCGLRIDIRKNIPIAGGMGGGSSDAATVLSGTNALLGLRMTTDELMRLARGLGSDVPFFMLDVPYALGRSRGDKLEKVLCEVTLWHLIVCPSLALSTKEMYAAFDSFSGSGHDFALTKKRSDAKIKLAVKNSVDFNAIESMLYNDLEEIIRSQKEVVAKIIKRLASSLGKKAILSGSGPSVFCLYGTRKEAMEARIKFLRTVPARERKGWQAHVIRTLY